MYVKKKRKKYCNGMQNAFYFWLYALIDNWFIKSNLCINTNQINNTLYYIIFHILQILCCALYV